MGRKFNARILVFSGVSSTFALTGSPPLTPEQQRFIEDARSEAVNSSLRAEGEFLELFQRPEFRWAFRLEGAGNLAALPPSALLEMLKANLASLEYTNNFGLDARSRRLHPGREAMDFTTIDRYGHVPQIWEMRADGLPLVANVSQKQWAISDAAETGLYGFPAMADLAHPTAEEARQRPQYLAGNLRRSSVGLQRYGAYAAVMRNDVVRERALLLGADSGGWTNVCNKSVAPIKPSSRDWLHKAAAPCDPIMARGERHRPILGVVGHQLHTILANANTFERTGGGLSRLLYQLLTPGAGVRPLEENMYTEGALVGPLRPEDMKLLVASFPDVFGSSSGQDVRNFCKRHGVPLAWGLGPARMWPQEDELPGLLLPWEPFYFWEAGGTRIVDLEAGWLATNITQPPVDMAGEWERVWGEVLAARNATSEPGREAWQGWWKRLVDATGSVPPLRAGDCDSADLCFGTLKGGDCVCRRTTAKAQDMVSAEWPLVV